MATTSHATIPHITTRPDPIEAAIARHRAAYDAYQVAPEGEQSLWASDDYDAASDALVTTACTTRFGALALLEHLRWWLADEAECKEGHQPAYGIAEARAADLTLFLGTNLPPVAIHAAAPFGRLAPSRHHRVAPVLPRDEDVPGSVEPWQAVTPVRPDTAHSRALRVLNASAELLACLVIIGGGAALVGFASHF